MAADPVKAAGLSRKTLCTLLRATKVLAAELEYLVTLAPAPSAAEAPRDDVEDRRLTPKEAAAYLGVTPRWLRSHKDIPGKITHGRYIRYDQRILSRYQQRRASR